MADQRHLYAGAIHGGGQGAFEQAYDTFRVARDLLSAADLTFGDVVRTWIYLRDIDRDYDEFNRARRAFFQDCGLERKPASTGVGGAPCAEAHDFQLALYAIGSPRPLTITPMSSATLNEAWTYGADFSRGLKVTDANKHALYVSGTASIGESGQTVAVGDFAAQADRMLCNIESLLAAQGATFADIVSGATYVKNATDARALRAMFRSRGFDGFPCALVEAPLCRPELLCETEVMATLSLSAARG
jgi:enamine deaminase RidA (YjgF/YER057c/UK114 family)